ncbi:MAG TPA: leucyl aminopeptidase [Candidatus Saccharimonadales bacterium]|jgi:leucyl aminopeptidase|nr:leucyl aminopeptidase [Candidatus Saccharimonadales bacterium]
MDTRLIAANIAEVETECLVIVALDHGDKQKADPRLAHPEPALKANKAAAELIASGEVTGKALETVLVHRPEGLKAKRLLIVGGGKAKAFGSAELRKTAGAAVRFLKGRMIKSCAFALPATTGSADDAVRAIVEGAIVADFDPDTYRTDRKDLRMKDISVVASAAPSPDLTRLQRSFDQGRMVAESQNFTRELVNEPSNRLTPTMLADRARLMCESVGLKCEIMGPAKIKELKMGAFWSVAQGSDEEPRLIVVRYEPAGAPEKPVLGLVGKGITFDTGGISIKSADGMEKMKYDMAGGAAMLGAMRAIALLKPKVKVIAIVCATENMPSGKAQKPGDVQIAMSGKAIEIINTDAEGRLVLADGLHYARTLGCTHLIDAATLTGAIGVALGQVNAGLFANDEDIYQHFTQALQRSGEKFWRMPLDPEYLEIIRSNIADILNSGGRLGGAITAAMFLKEFVADTPWIHLDIASTTWIDDNRGWIAKGPSGMAVRSLVEFVRSFEG